MLSLVLSLAALAIPQAGDGRCGFTITADSTRPEVVASESGSRSVVALQPESPLRITRVDITGASFGASGSGGGAIRIDVVNASNRPIEGAAVGFTFGSGASSTSGAAAFTTTLAPSAGMRVDARLPGTSSEGTPLSAVMIYVRSVNIGGCTFEPGYLTPSFSAGTRKAPEEACAFTASAGEVRPDVDGPPELLSRVQVVEQPRSPLQIRRVDVSRLDLNVGDTWTQLRGAYEIEVQNVSDHPILHAAVLLVTRAGGTPAGGEGALWKGTLDPGKSRTVEAKVARFDDIPPGANAADVRLVALIGPVVIDGCTYVPSRGYPRK